MRNLFISNDPVNKNKRRDLRKNFTDAERKLWSKLRNKQVNGSKFYRQYGIGPYILDFYCHDARLAVEADGGQHLLDPQLIYDKRRTEFLNRHSIKVLRFSDIDILKNLDEVILEIERNLTPPRLASLVEAGQPPLTKRRRIQKCAPIAQLAPHNLPC